VEQVLDIVDLVLVMSVNPGFGGQSFIAAQLEKLRALRRRLDAVERTIDLEVDGGINAETAAAAVAAGADVLVAGSASFAGRPPLARGPGEGGGDLAGVAPRRLWRSPWRAPPRRVLSGSAPSHLTLGGPAPAEPAVTLNDPWPGDAERGNALLAGEFRLAGAT